MKVAFLSFARNTLFTSLRLSSCTRLGVLTAILVQIQVFWGLTRCVDC